MKSAILVTLLAVLHAGCLFEPECSTYDECTEPASNVATNNTTTANTTTGSNSTTPANANSNTAPSNQMTKPDCSVADCPAADDYSFGGTREDPLGCTFSGNLDFFEFEDEAEVCAGSPRGYSLWIESCDTPYIVEVEVTVPDTCVGTALLDFELDGFDCDKANTRCESSGNTALAQFIIDPREFGAQRLDFQVDAGSRGFGYFLTVRSRR